MELTRQVAILLVEDHELMRFGVKSLLKTVENAIVVGETDNGPEAIQLAEKLKPDFVLMDLKLNNSD
ncbi:response regulator, partial [Acinetobacter baumannii]